MNNNKVFSPRGAELRVDKAPAHLPPEHKYFPVKSDFLRSEKALGFDLYMLRPETRTLSLLLSSGDVPSEEIREQVREGTFPRQCYVRGDQKRALLEYEKTVVEEILRDDGVDLAVKCSTVHDLTTLLSEDLFENPTRSAILAQRENVSRLVALVVEEPAAVKGLLALTHHDYYTYTHSVNTGHYALAIALEYFGAEARANLNEIAAGFFLHDIGKCRIAPAIINKDGPLTEAEWAQMRKHPVYGIMTLAQEDALSPEVETVVFQHHERADGGGYPEGLHGEQIHPYARICKIADTYDAMTTNRSYKGAMSPFAALAVMRSQMREQFDREMFKTFVLLMGGRRADKGPEPYGETTDGRPAT